MSESYLTVFLVLEGGRKGCVWESAPLRVMHFDSMCSGVGVCCRRARRAGWVRAGLYKKAERSTEALSVVQVHHCVWHLLGFSAWLGSRGSHWSVFWGGFLFVFFFFCAIRGPLGGEESQAIGFHE